MDFPQYRKYANGLNYFKIIDKNHLEEIQLIGKKYAVNQLEARILPERNFIMDLLEMSSGYILEISEKEYMEFYEDCLTTRQKF